MIRTERTAKEKQSRNIWGRTREHREKNVSHCIPCAIWQNSSGECLAGTWWRPICRWALGNNSFSLISFQCWVSSFPPRLDFSPPDKTVPPELPVSVSLCSCRAQGMPLQAVCLSFPTYSRGINCTERCLGSFAFSRAFLQELKP